MQEALSRLRPGLLFVGSLRRNWSRRRNASSHLHCGNGCDIGAFERPNPRWLKMIAPSFESVIINAGVTLTCSPAPTFVGEDSFTYTISDCHGATAAAAVTVVVLNVAPMVNIGPDVALDEGQNLLAAGSLTNPGVNMWTGVVDYGERQVSNLPSFLL